MTFHARNQVEVLLDGLDILRLEETEYDGRAFSGPKHWHTFDILARKPASDTRLHRSPLKFLAGDTSPVFGRSAHGRCGWFRVSAETACEIRTRRFRGNVAHVAPEDRFPIEHANADA